MARSKRAKSNSGVYHVVLRGINKQRIFEEESDFKKFLFILGDYKEECNFELFAYCLMPNHIHLLLQEKDDSLSVVIHKIGTRFAHWYNKKYERVGHLFQNRFKSEPVDDWKYFLTVVRYIHLNPVTGGICHRPQDYNYSSYTHYFDVNGLVDSKKLLLVMEKKDFKSFHEIQDSTQCLDDADGKRNKPTDEQLHRLLMQHSGCKTVSEVQKLSVEHRNHSIRELLKTGASARQISRVSGISIGVIRYCIKKSRQLSKE